MCWQVVLRHSIFVEWQVRYLVYIKFIGYEKNTILHSKVWLLFLNNITFYLMRLQYLLFACVLLLGSAYAQNFGIGVATPTQKLDVAGAIRLQNTTVNNLGAIRYNGTDVEAYLNLGNPGDPQWYSLSRQQLVYTAGAGINITGTTVSTLPHTGDATGSVALRVERLDGRSLDLTDVPVNGDVLKYDSGAGLWKYEPGTVVTDVTLTGTGTAATPLGLAQQGAITGQGLVWNGTGWRPLRVDSLPAPLGNNHGVIWNGSQWISQRVDSLPAPLGNNHGVVWNGTQWISQRVDSLPAGTIHQTLRHDGTTWVPTSMITNTDTQVGVGTSTIAASSILEIESSDKALRMPRVADTSAVGSAPVAVEGQVVYDQNDKMLYLHDGTRWIPMSNDTLPLGFINQTMRHNGTTWVRDSALLNTGSQVAVASPTIAPTSVLEIGGTNQALRLPRVADTSAVGSAPNAVEGQVVYDQSDSLVYVHDGKKWKPLGGGSGMLVNMVSGTGAVTAPAGNPASVADYVLIPGLTQTISIPNDGKTYKLMITSHGYGSLGGVNQSGNAMIGTFIDNTLLFFFPGANTTGITGFSVLNTAQQLISPWSFSYTVPITAGTHSVDVRCCRNGGSGISLSGGPGAFAQGTLTVAIIRE